MCLSLLQHQATKIALITLTAGMFMTGCATTKKIATGVETENFTAENVHIDQVIAHHGNTYKTRNYPNTIKYVWHSHNIPRSKDVYLGASRNGQVRTHHWGVENYNVEHCLSYVADRRTGMVKEIQRGVCDSVLYPEAEAAARAAYGYALGRLFQKAARD